MHNGFLNIDGEKMSKSAGNFFLARDVLQHYDADTIRFFFLSKHYRSTIDYNSDLLAESKAAITRFYEVFRNITPNISNKPSKQSNLPDNLATKLSDFHIAMSDDFNTAKAITYLFDLTNIAFSKDYTAEQKQTAVDLLFEFGNVLGFFRDYDSIIAKKIDNKTEQLINLLIELRINAKKEKNFALADKIRDELKNIGIELRDTTNGVEWRCE
jgi:cysteinyl-tRNA synthetase